MEKRTFIHLIKKMLFRLKMYQLDFMYETFTGGRTPLKPSDCYDLEKCCRYPQQYIEALRRERVEEALKWVDEWMEREHPASLKCNFSEIVYKLS